MTQNSFDIMKSYINGTKQSVIDNIDMTNGNQSLKEKSIYIFDQILAINFDDVTISNKFQQIYNDNLGNYNTIYSLKIKFLNLMLDLISRKEIKLKELLESAV